MHQSKIPLRVLHALYDAGWTNERIQMANGRDLFAAFCEWEGLINWDSTLWEAVTALSKG